MSEAPESFAKAANPETEIGVEMCIRLGKGTIKLDMALAKNAESTTQFMKAVALLSGKEPSVPAASARTALASNEFGIKLNVGAGKNKTRRDIVISQDAPEARKFMDAVAVLIGLTQAS